MADDKKEENKSNKKAKKILKYGGLIAAGAALPVLGIPALIGAAGFGAGGIAAGSLAASMMSASATTGVGAGVVAICQSIGAAGMAAGTVFGLGTAGAATGLGIAAATDIPKKTENKGDDETGKTKVLSYLVPTSSEASSHQGQQTTTTRRDKTGHAKFIVERCELSFKKGDVWQESIIYLLIVDVEKSSETVLYFQPFSPESSSNSNILKLTLMTKIELKDETPNQVIIFNLEQTKTTKDNSAETETICIIFETDKVAKKIYDKLKERLTM